MRSSILTIAASVGWVVVAWPGFLSGQHERDFVFTDEDGHLVLRFAGTEPDGLDAHQIDRKAVPLPSNRFCGERPARTNLRVGCIRRSMDITDIELEERLAEADRTRTMLRRSTIERRIWSIASFRSYRSGSGSDGLH
jgi:hypothetical protein